MCTTMLQFIEGPVNFSHVKEAKGSCHIDTEERMKIEVLKEHSFLISVKTNTLLLF